MISSCLSAYSILVNQRTLNPDKLILSSILNQRFQWITVWDLKFTITAFNAFAQPHFVIPKQRKHFPNVRALIFPMIKNFFVFNKLRHIFLNNEKAGLLPQYQPALKLNRFFASKITIAFKVVNSNTFNRGILPPSFSPVYSK